MRSVLVVVGLGLLAVGCGRSFTAPRAAGGDPLSARPAWVALAPNQEMTFQFQGGVPPYSVSALVDAGLSCGIRDDDGGPQGRYAACLRPGVQDTVTLRDAAGASVQIPVSIGPALQASIPQGSEQECTEVELTIAGGKPAYTLVWVDGGPPPACADAGALQLAPRQNISRYAFRVPPYVPGGANRYALEILDAVENAKRGAGGAPDPRNVVDFSLEVTATPAALTVASPIQVTPGSTVSLSYAPHDRQVAFRLAPDGNSSGCSVTPGGLYTAGLNTNTVDHVLVDAPGLDAPLDIWIEVGNPVVVLPVVGPGAVLAGDLNGDGITDMVLLSDRGSGGALPMVLLQGSAAGPALSGSVYLPLPPNSRPDGLELADVNGDGPSDVVLAYSGSGPGSGPGGVEVYLSQPGGSFADVGPIPDAPAALPGLFGAGELLLGSGELVTASRAGGGLAFADAGLLLPLQSPGSHVAQVVVAHDGLGVPWGAFAASVAFGPGGAAVAVDGYGDLDGGAVHLDIGPQQGRQLAPVHALPLGQGGDEAIVIWDPPGPSGGADTLWVQAPPAQQCPLTAVPFASLGPAGDPSWSDPVSDVVPLPELGALAVATTPAGAATIGGQWHLVLGSGCGLRGASWTELALPDLTQNHLITALASGDFNGDGLADLAVLTPGRLETFLGSVAGRFGAGDQFATTGPLASLSASRPGVGGGLVAGMELLDQRVQVFVTANNHAPDGGRTSDLAYAAAWSVPGLSGVLLRGRELWTAQSSAGAVTIARYLDATDPSGPHPATLLPGGALATAELTSLFQADPTRDDAAWVVLADPQSHEWVPMRIEAEDDGGLHVQALPRLPRSSGAYCGAQGLPDGGLELLLFDGTSTTIYAGTAVQAQATFGAAQPGSFVPACQADNPALFVPGAPLVVLSGFPACRGPLQGGCCVGGGPAQFIYNRADGGLLPANLPSSVRMRSALATPLVDGGTEVLGAGVGQPGVFAIVADPVSGAWSLDPSLRDGAPALELGPFPDADGGPTRHVASQLSPGSLQIIGR